MIFLPATGMISMILPVFARRPIVGYPYQWWWEVQYLERDGREQVTTANEIHVPVGRPVELDVISREVIHSFWVPQLHGKIDLVPGQVNRMRLVVDQPGTYRGQCAEFCGLQHAHMSLLVIGDPEDQFEAWLARERARPLRRRRPTPRRVSRSFCRRPASRVTRCAGRRRSPGWGPI